jgi:hypothetical protein
MKTSNKLLLGTIAGFFLVITMAHITLTARYRSGIFITEQDEYEKQHVRTNLKPFRVLVLKEISNVKINFSDTAKLVLYKNGDEKYINIRQNGDTLYIENKSINKEEKYYRDIELFSPLYEKIIAYDTQVETGDVSGAKKLQYDIDLYKSQFNIQDVRYEFSNNKIVTQTKFDSIRVHAFDGSGIQVNETIFLSHLSLNLEKGSRIEASNPNIQSMDVVVNPEAQISLSGRALKAFMEAIKK